MKNGKLTPLEKRRIRDRNRQLAELDAKHQSELAAAKQMAMLEGRLEGQATGAKIVRDKVLEHAGRLYKERKDSDAAAVREVHRQL